MKLLNGRTLGEAFEILARPQKKSKSREGGKSYWTIEEYYCRMAEVFGASGYSVAYQLQPPFVFENTKQVMLTCQCTINIYGENGGIIYSTMGCGGKQIDRLSAKDEHGNVKADEERYYTELNNLPYNVQVSAFKSACKSMNIFGALSGADGGDSAVSSQSSHRQSGQSGSGSSSEIMSFYVKDVFEEERKDGNTGMPVYSLQAHRIEGEKCYEQTDTIIFYPNKYKSVQNVLYAYMDKKTPYRISLKVKKGARGGYIFDGFVSS